MVAETATPSGGCRSTVALRRLPSGNVRSERGAHSVACVTLPTSPPAIGVAIPINRKWRFLVFPRVVHNTAHCDDHNEDGSDDAYNGSHAESIGSGLSGSGVGVERCIAT